MLKKIISFIAIAIAIATSCSEVSAQSVASIDSVKIDSVKASGSFGVVYLKYFNATGAGAFSYQANYGPLTQVNVNSSHVKTVPPGTSTDSIWCYLSGGFSGGQDYDFRVTFITPAWAQSLVTTATAISGPPATCAVSAGVSTSLVCLGGSATLSANGTAGMSYNWTPGNLLGSTVTVTPTTNTTYTVVGVDLNNCSDTAAVVVNVNTNPGISVSNDTTVCLGSSLVLRVFGGTSYQWGNGSTGDTLVVSPVANATYNVTVTGTSSCIISKEIIVSVVTVNPVVSASTDTVCLNGIQNVVLSSSIPGGSWSMYVFSNVFDHVLAGVGRHPLTYTVNIGGCVGKDTVYVVVLDTPSVSSWNYDNVGNLILNGSFPYNIVMTVNGTTYAPSVQNANTVVFSSLSLSQGELVIIKSQGGDCFVLFYFTSTHADEALENYKIVFYPNPVRDGEFLNINSLNGRMLIIFNTHGQQIYSGFDEQVDVSGWPVGLYMARVGDSARNFKILKE